jgi:hypothetical protein
MLVMKNKIRVFILDDRLPKPQEFVERSIFNAPISQSNLKYLVQHGKWTDEPNLKRLLSDVLSHEYTTQGFITLSGYTNPEICISNLSKKHMPHVIVYDWEYENQTKQSGPWLLEILEMTKAFVFVYSGVRNSVPPTLNKREFDPFAKRFQFFAKGSSTDSVFTSEEFLYQYILSLVSNNNVIKVGGLSVEFESSGYLSSPTDILHLEAILGRASLLNLIEENRNKITAKSVEKMIESINGRMLLSREKGVLVSPGFSLFNKAAAEEISYLVALKEFGLGKLEEALQTGFAKV